MTAVYDPAAGDRVVVPVALVPVRRDPIHRSELVSQWLLGETITVEDRDSSWLRARGGDGYAGWTPAAPFRHRSDTAEEWQSVATHYSLGTPVSGFVEPPRDEPGLRRLPWGARVGIARDGSGQVVLPNGSLVSPGSPRRLIPQPTRVESPHAATVLAIARAREWQGVPYLWGGRSELGVDCSGFVQAVLATLGLELPRDSHEQAVAGTDLMGGHAAPRLGGLSDMRSADLLFFAPEGKAVTHVAMSLGGGRIIHAASSNGAVQEDDLEADDPLCRLLAGSIVAHTRPLGGEGPAQP